MGPSEPEIRVVLVTAPDAGAGAELARAVVGERLAACVNVVPGVRSIYHWNGTVQEEDEVLLVMKTTNERLEALTLRVIALHPYDVPEVLALPEAGGSAAYRAWLLGEVGA